MAVSNFTVKFSGTVAYDDNTNGSFEATAVWQGELGGVVATHNSENSQYHMAQLYADRSASVDLMLSSLGTITISPPTQSPDKTVSSFIAELSGTVTYDDGTSNGFFIVQWINGVIDLFPTDSTTHWGAIANSATASVFMTTALEALVGSGQATI